MSSGNNKGTMEQMKDKAKEIINDTENKVDDKR